MKLATIRAASGATTVAAVVDDRVIPLTKDLTALGFAAESLLDVLREDALPAVIELEPLLRDRATNADSTSVDSTEFLAPVPAPASILAVAANFRAHVRETGTIQEAERNESTPWLFSKPRNSLNPHRAPVVLPTLYARNVDWEGELGAIIGRRATRVSVGEALDYVAGYTIVNDISARKMDMPTRTKLRDRDTFHDWLHGKWFDTFCCIGPWMVTADEIPDPSALQLSLSVNGTLYQNAPTSDMIFSTQELISFASHTTTLEPGDVIALGTPSGVGKASGRFLKEGDTMTVTIDAIGSLVNDVVAER